MQDIKAFVLQVEDCSIASEALLVALLWMGPVWELLSEVGRERSFLQGLCAAHTIKTVHLGAR